MPEAERIQGIQRLILLDEEGKPIKSWDLQGKISLIIGKAGRDQELDIDLSDCEYSSFIDVSACCAEFLSGSMVCGGSWVSERCKSRKGGRRGMLQGDPPPL